MIKHYFKPSIITINKCEAALFPYSINYASTKDGKVFSSMSGTWEEMKPNAGTTGYPTICLTLPGYCGVEPPKSKENSKAPAKAAKNRKWFQKSFSLHRFVWICWKGAIPEALVIDHINANKKDCKLSNLQTLTYSENSKKGYQDRAAMMAIQMIKAGM